jgi:Tol biopolymer transport system component
MRGAATDVTWAPDGRRIAFVRFSSKRINLIGIDGRAGRTLETGAGEASEVAWSPTGPLIAYVAGGLDRELYVIRPNGTGRRQLTHTGGHVYGIDWSPDGTRIVFSIVEIGRPGGVWIIRADGTRLRRVVRLAADDFDCCAWSPDSRVIAYTPTVGRSIALVTPSGRRIGGLRIDRRLRAFSRAPRRIDYLDDIEWLAERRP